MTSRTPHDAHLGIVINRAQFDVCTPSSFGGVKANVRFKQNCAE